MWKLFNKRDDDGRRGHAAPEQERVAGANIVKTTIAEIEHIGETAVATLTITELTADEGVERLSELLDELYHQNAKHMVLDIQNVQYMDSACLGSLVAALNRMSAQGGRIALVNPGQSVSYIFKLTRLDRVFPMCNDVMAGIEAVETGGRRIA